MYLFENWPSGILTKLSVLRSPQTTHGIQTPPMMHYKLVWYYQLIMRLTITFITNFTKQMLWNYTWIMITQIARWMTWLCGSTTKANGKYHPWIPQKSIPIMSITGEHLYQHHQIVLKLNSRPPLNWNPSVFIYRWSDISNPGFLIWITQDSLMSTPQIPSTNLPKK